MVTGFVINSDFKIRNEDLLQCIIIPKSAVKEKQVIDDLTENEEKSNRYEIRVYRSPGRFNTETHKYRKDMAGNLSLSSEVSPKNMSKNYTNCFYHYDQSGVSLRIHITPRLNSLPRVTVPVFHLGLYDVSDYVSKLFEFVSPKFYVLGEVDSFTGENKLQIFQSRFTKSESDVKKVVVKSGISVLQNYLPKKTVVESLRVINEKIKISSHII